MADDPQQAANDSQQQAKDLEIFKARLQIKAIWLDKLLLAIVVVVVGAYANSRLAQHENSLNSQLESLKSSQIYDRLRAERRVASYERVWGHLMQFRKSVDSCYGLPITDKRMDTLRAEFLAFVSNADIEDIYLDDMTRKSLEKLSDEHLPTFLEKWKADKNQQLSRPTWIWLNDRIQEVRLRIGEGIDSIQPVTRDKAPQSGNDVTRSP